MADQTPKTPATYDVTLTMEGPADAQYPVGFSARWANGKTMELDVRHNLPQHIALWCMVHGAKQKIFDAAAIARDPKTGKSATVDQKYEAAEEVRLRLLSGDWFAPREGGAGGSYLFKALCRIKSEQEPQAIRDWLATRSDAEKKALELNPAIASVIAEIKAEAIKTENIDSDALLAQLK